MIVDPFPVSWGCINPMPWPISMDQRDEAEPALLEGRRNPNLRAAAIVHPDPRRGV